LRIAVLVDQLKIGGVQKVAVEEARHLRKLGHQVDLLAIWPVVNVRRQRPSVYADLLNEICPQALGENFHGPFRFSLKFPGFDFFSLFHVTSPLITPKILARRRYDVVICHGTYTCFTAYTLWKRNEIPYVAFIWDPISYVLSKAYSNASLGLLLPVLRPFAFRLDKLLVDNSLATLTGSKVHLPFLESLSSGRVSVLYPGCYPSEKLPVGRGDYILSVIRWNAIKQPGRLVDLMARTDPSLRLIVTDGYSPRSEMVQSFLTRARTKGVSQRISLEGPANQRRLKELYIGARALIHTSVEAFGMTALEAASHGCPFIIPEGSGVTELFTNGVHGFFPKEEDEEALLVSVNRFADELFAREMGHRAWEVAKQYSWINHARKLEQILVDRLG